MLLTNPTHKSILKAIDNYLEKSAIKTDFIILYGEKCLIDIPLLIQQLNKRKLHFLGALFHKIIYEQAAYIDKALLIPTFFEQKPILVHGLDNGNIHIPIDNNHSINTKTTFLTFVDGLSAYISKFLYKLYDKLGNEPSIIGGGAGRQYFVHEPCIFTKDGFHKNAAVIASIKRSCSLSVKHGWSVIEGPFIATKTKANIVETINWRPAFEVYKEVLDKHSNQNITPKNFYTIARAYPLGMYRTYGESVVRDAIAVREDGALIFVAEIPENTVLFVLTGDKNDLLNATNEATMASIAGATLPIKHIFAVECISRTELLGDNFQEELQCLSKHTQAKNVTIEGVVSLGEISSASKSLLEYYNKTLVVGSFY